MAKRFTATEIWDEDWFLSMPNEYKLFWYYMLSTCDHAGLFRVNLRSFCSLNEVNLTSNEALRLFNTDKQRIRVINKSVWLIEDFFVFQYGEKINLKNRVHDSIATIYQKLNIELTSIRGLINPNDGVKDKDKDMDNCIVTNAKNKNGKFSGNFKSQGEEVFAERIRRNGQSNGTGEEYNQE